MENELNFLDQHNVFIIAEAGVNHNGNIEIARKLVDAAVEAGADAVKFQTFTAESIATKKAQKAEYQTVNTGTSESQFDMLKNLELTYENHLELQKYCQDKGIVFFSTPFSIESVDLLEMFDVPLYKISSGDITNMVLLKYVATKGKPIILSTGMASLGEIEEAIGWILEAGNDRIVLMHCTTNYPARYDEVNLSAIHTIRQSFKLPVGYSDHTLGIEVPIAAVSMGASIIEKHFTLNRNMEGPDHKAALEPDELKKMVSSIRNIEVAMGDGIKRCMPSEEKVKKLVRKSIVANCDIRKGEIITEKMLTAKRLENGIEVKNMPFFIGKVAERDIIADELLTFDAVRGD